MCSEQSFGLIDVFTRKLNKKTSITNQLSHATKMHSIQDHLYRLLNARHGAIAHLPDYGLPDITQLYGDLPYAVDIIQTAITLCIQKYEPRLTNVKIVSMQDESVNAVLIFEIRATLLCGEQAAFHAYLTSNGNAEVIHQKQD